MKPELELQLQKLHCSSGAVITGAKLDSFRDGTRPFVQWLLSPVNGTLLCRLRQNSLQVYLAKDGKVLTM